MSQGLQQSMLSRMKRRIAVCSVIGLALCAAAVWFHVWAGSQYGQAEAVSVATAFMSRLRSADFNGAHAMTVKNAYVGASPEELRRLARREAPACWEGGLTSISPPQTNGNRLRRWLRGQAVELNELNAEFEKGTCLLSVRLRRVTGAEWKVFYFASHAG